MDSCVSLVPNAYSVLAEILDANSFCIKENTNKMEKDIEVILLLNPVLCRRIKVYGSSLPDLISVPDL